MHTTTTHPSPLAVGLRADGFVGRLVEPGDADLAFTVRGGGHSVSGRSVRDGALCIDLRALNGVEVDPRSAASRSHDAPSA